jgi:hypothetical protein
MADCDAGDESSRFSFLGASHSRIEIVHFKPQQYAVSIRLEILIPDWAVMVCHIPPVQLQVSVAHSKQAARTRGRRVRFGSRAGVDTSHCLLRHHARKSKVVAAQELRG